MPGISNTIKVNLGGSSNNNNDKEEDKNDSMADELKSIVNKEAALSQEAMGKNLKQQTSTIKAMKQCGGAAVENGVGIGALASLKVDYCTHCHGQGLLPIMYRLNTDLSLQ